MGGDLYVVRWRPLGAARRRSQVRPCADVAEAARIAAGLVWSDGGGWWRVYGTVLVSDRSGSLKAGRGARRGALLAGNGDPSPPSLADHLCALRVSPPPRRDLLLLTPVSGLAASTAEHRRR